LVWLWGLLGLLLVVVAYDLVQRKHAILRNFPIVGHFRYILEAIGPELRQYIVTSNDEELPFSRDQRRWIYTSAKRVNTYTGFGTDNDLEHSSSYLIIKHDTLGRMDTHHDEAKNPTYRLPCAKVVGAHRRRRLAFRPDSVVNVSAMSFGSLSGAAVEAMNRGAKISGCLHNTGEGGIAEHHLHGGELIWQIGTGYFGCRTSEGRFDRAEFLRKVESHPVRAVEIKLSQGAKPGLGGVLPGAKVTAEIAAIRGIPAGKDSISPNRHPDISSTADLLDQIAHIREVTGKPVGFKCVIGAFGWLDGLFEEVKRRGTASAPDFITIDSGDGGTGAAPMPLMDNVGLLIRESLPLVDDIRKRHGMGDRVRLIASGKFVTPSAAAVGLCSARLPGCPRPRTAAVIASSTNRKSGVANSMPKRRLR
jgi:glutamate synthase domain-containing protein 2